MKISRCGSAAYFGESSISLPTPSISWNPIDSSISIKHSRVKDFATDSNHDYAISLSIEEASKIIAVLSNAAIENPASFEECMPSSLKDVVRLQAVLAGLVRP